MDDLNDQQVAELLERATGQIEALESHMVDLPQVEIPVSESFVNGMYVRRIMIPAGTLLTGRVHKYPYVDIMLAGDIAVATPEGPRRLTGYHVLDGQAGRKRAGYAFEATEWVTVHRTDLVEPGDMVERLTFFSRGEWEIWRDQADYPRVLEEFGFTEAEVQAQVTNGADQVVMDVRPHFLTMQQSRRHGFGLFAERAFAAGAVIGPARIMDKRTPLGRFTNHSADPNCRMHPDGSYRVVLQAIRDIEPGTELTIDYRQALRLQIEPAQEALA